VPTERPAVVHRTFIHLGPMQPGSFLATHDERPPPGFNPLEPFANEALLERVMGDLAKFDYKLYGQRPVLFHRGRPTKYEFDLNLGVIHFTEQDFQGLSEVFARVNVEWGTKMTFCIYPSKEKPRDMILNVRGSPMAPSEID
jgi:hypothetical protein